MISNEKMEKLWWQYKNEGVAKNLSRQAFCSMNNVPYNAFEKYLKLRPHFSDVHHITVTDLPQQETPEATAAQTEVSAPEIQTETSVPAPAVKVKSAVRIMIHIHMSNGMQVSKKTWTTASSTSWSTNPVYDLRRNKADFMAHARQA